MKDNMDNNEPTLWYSDLIYRSYPYCWYTTDTVFTVYVDPENPENYFVDLNSEQQRVGDQLIKPNKHKKMRIELIVVIWIIALGCILHMLGIDVLEALKRF